MKLPLEILKDKYIPVKVFAEQHNMTEEQVMNLLQRKRIKYTEFRAPGERLRTPHVNPEDILPILEKEKSR